MVEVSVFWVEVAVQRRLKKLKVAGLRGVWDFEVQRMFRASPKPL